MEALDFHQKWIPLMRSLEDLEVRLGLFTLPKILREADRFGQNDAEVVMRRAGLST